MAKTVAGARPLSKTWGGTRTTLRPDYEAMISSSYDLQAAANRKALAEMRGPSVGEQELIGRGMESMVEEYNRSYGEARTANEQRYQEMLGISRGETQRQAGVQQGMLDVVGETTGQRAADIRAEGIGRESDIMQRLARQGMSGTTIAPTMREGVRRGTQESLNRLADEMQRTKLGVMEQQAAARRGTELGIMERREDPYPEAAPVSEAIQSAGAGLGGLAGRAMTSRLMGQIRR